MRIAVKASLFSLTVFFGLTLFLPQSFAQDVSISTGSSGVDVSINTNGTKDSKDSVDVSLDKNDDSSEEDLGESPKIPDSVKNVVKRLNHATKDITLEDLNSAREAVVKLDVLIDIEKRLNDLMSLRKEREETVDDLSAVIPNSAVNGAPPSVSSMQTVNPVPIAMPNVSSVENVEVIRVMGASGRYVALIRDLDGSEQQVKVGDVLFDGSKVKAISNRGVLIRSGSKKRLIKIKDAGTLFTR